MVNNFFVILADQSKFVLGSPNNKEYSLLSYTDIVFGGLFYFKIYLNFF